MPEPGLCSWTLGPSAVLQALCPSPGLWPACQSASDSDGHPSTHLQNKYKTNIKQSIKQSIKQFVFPKLFAQLRVCKRKPDYFLTMETAKSQFYTRGANCFMDCFMDCFIFVLYLFYECFMGGWLAGSLGLGSAAGSWDPASESGALLRWALGPGHQALGSLGASTMPELWV